MIEPHPELHGADDDDSRGPVYGERRRRALRITVLVALGALLLPLVLSVYGTAHSAAQRACAVYVAQFDTDATGARVSFELFGRTGAGWQCYSVAASGGETLIAELGLLPGAPRPIDDDERDA
ncbi:hypothetical protein DCE93_03660 [Agromyces badenianii]|uniref:Uncharacterized protein n=1 Tax=Agromyces badenianii TaxID=2080742 RepID=A0A2S0WU43_9MICO|nr:hypothetical protein [Agromyces badenianii]AWB94866.1 hypothetical protein DCE93_03660 [Agromyces badenianii]